MIDYNLIFYSLLYHSILVEYLKNMDIQLIIEKSVECILKSLISYKL